MSLQVNAQSATGECLSVVLLSSYCISCVSHAHMLGLCVLVFRRVSNLIGKALTHLVTTVNVSSFFFWFIVGQMLWFFGVFI